MLTQKLYTSMFTVALLALAPNGNHSWPLNWDWSTQSGTSIQRNCLAETHKTVHSVSSTDGSQPCRVLVKEVRFKSPHTGWFIFMTFWKRNTERENISDCQEGWKAYFQGLKFFEVLELSYISLGWPCDCAFIRTHKTYTKEVVLSACKVFLTRENCQGSRRRWVGRWFAASWWSWWNPCGRVLVLPHPFLIIW